MYGSDKKCRPTAYNNVITIRSFILVSDGDGLCIFCKSKADPK